MREAKTFEAEEFEDVMVRALDEALIDIKKALNRNPEISIDGASIFLKMGAAQAKYYNEVEEAGTRRGRKGGIISFTRKQYIPVSIGGWANKTQLISAPFFDWEETLPQITLKKYAAFSLYCIVGQTCRSKNIEVKAINKIHAKYRVQFESLVDGAIRLKMIELIKVHDHCLFPQPNGTDSGPVLYRTMYTPDIASRYFHTAVDILSGFYPERYPTEIEVMKEVKFRWDKVYTKETDNLRKRLSEA